MNDQIKAALDELEALGSVEAIADFLLKEGCKGERKEVRCCPIAKFLTRRIGTPAIAAIDHCYEAGLAEDSVDSPPLVIGFIEAFDSKKFPALIDRRPA